MITSTPGFFDDIESGTGEWTHSGPGDNWHTTEHKSYSPSHSWYCGLEGTWQYTNNNNSSLISPYFVVTPGGPLRFWHQYRLETNYDFGYLEIDNGSGWWHKIGEFNGMMTTWSQFSYPLAAYDGQTVKIRFRLASDAGLVLEGWYIDDVFGTMLGIHDTETNPPLKAISLNISPNPFSRLVQINYQIPYNQEIFSIMIYDASGRSVREFNSTPIQSNSLIWDGTDEKGLDVPAGIYFVRLASAETEAIEKIVLLK
jgi:hypothetical protein